MEQMVCLENKIILSMTVVDFHNYYLQIILIASIAAKGSIIVIVLTTDIIRDFVIVSSTTLARINL